MALSWKRSAGQYGLLKADEKVAGYIPTYVHTLQALFFQTFLALA